MKTLENYELWTMNYERMIFKKENPILQKISTSIEQIKNDDFVEVNDEFWNDLKSEIISEMEGK